MIKQTPQRIWAYKIRNLINGESVEDFDTSIDLTVHTKAPEKWLLIDLETGQMYRGLNIPNEWGKWKRLKNNFRNLLTSQNLDSTIY